MEMYKKEKMFEDSLEEFDIARCVLSALFLNDAHSSWQYFIARATCDDLMKEWEPGLYQLCGLLNSELWGLLTLLQMIRVRWFSKNPVVLLGIFLNLLVVLLVPAVSRVVVHLWSPSPCQWRCSGQYVSMLVMNIQQFDLRYWTGSKCWRDSLCTRGSFCIHVSFIQPNR